MEDFLDNNNYLLAKPSKDKVLELPIGRIPLIKSTMSTKNTTVAKKTKM